MHPFDANWHICMDKFVFDNKSGLVELFTTMTKLNK